ncbi:hypothetical protein H4219_002086 [Mycoemilia scoparia]|uniref:Zn(2)-C6 fungal-type domain-containing protein n=1 Tax=Mycoemilia scoparia TaxID=417184 RepID=A0A9W8A201_9FUNG|nr:hypothetical protein H4219_002086 [Mycoemilia scoparia]
MENNQSSLTHTPGASTGDENTYAAENQNHPPLRLLRACDYCRKRKVKCDGERPACSHCQRVGAHCHYSLKPKSRRTWKCLERNGEGDTANGTGPGDKSINDTPSSGAYNATTKLFERVEAMEKLLLQQQQQEAKSNVGKNSISSLGLRTGWMMPGTNSTINDLPPKHIVDELINIFFEKQLSYWWIIHQQTFRRQLEEGTAPHILLYAVMAMAAKHSSHPQVRVNPPSDSALPFLHRAKLLMPHIIDKPSLAHAQALMLMTVSFLGLGEDHATTAYKYKRLHYSTAISRFVIQACKGIFDHTNHFSLSSFATTPLFVVSGTIMAFLTKPAALTLNMCIDLGYNRIDSSEQAAPNIAPPPTDWVERESGRRVWWAIFKVENYVAVSLFVAPSIQAEYCDVNLPCDNIEWTRDRSSDQEGNRHKHQKVGPIHNLVSYFCQFALLFSKVAWLVTHTRSPSREALNEFRELNVVMEHWFDSLPNEIHLDSSDKNLGRSCTESQYYMLVHLNICHYVAIIQLNRGVLDFTDDRQLIEASQVKSMKTAIKMADLLRATSDIPVARRDFSWYMCIFKASLVHCFRLLPQSPNDPMEAQQDLALHRQQLRQGTSMWRLCYKLINNLDDMEQMIRMLPKHVPMADLVLIRKITKKGRSGLINQQLSGIFAQPTPPSVPKSNSMPTTLQPQSQQQQQQHQHQKSMSYAHNTHSPASSNEMFPNHNQVISSSTPMHSSIGKQTPDMMPLGISSPNATFRNNYFGGNTQTSTISVGPSIASHMISQPLMDSPGQFMAHSPNANPIQNPGGNGASAGGSLGNIEADPSNLVIDTNMAETLVNYFFMLTNGGNIASDSNGATASSNSAGDGGPAKTFGSALAPGIMNLVPSSNSSSPKFHPSSSSSSGASNFLNQYTTHNLGTNS